jgi:hypothetical protein
MPSMTVYESAQFRAPKFARIRVTGKPQSAGPAPGGGFRRCRRLEEFTLLLLRSHEYMICGIFFGMR